MKKYFNIHKIKNLNFKMTAVFALFSVIIYTTQCQKSFDSDSFAPANLPQAVIKAINVNSGGSFYCSISGGCPIVITGENFFSNAKVYIGPYLCADIVIAEDFKSVSCTAGPGQNGVYDISVKNIDGVTSKFDASVTDPSTLQFSYASFLYFGSQETPGKVYGYAQNPESGALLSIVGSPFSIAGHNGTYGVVIHPNNKFLYSANVSQKSVSTYSINPVNGKLTAVGTPVTASASGTNGLFFHPSGKYLYATNQSGSIEGFNVASDGTLTIMANSPFATTGSTSINGLVVRSGGKYLYAASMGGNGGVSGFSIDENTGELTLIPGSPFINTLGGDTTNPGDGITIHPNGQWLYMGLVNLHKVSGWTIDDGTGVLTAIEAPVLNNATTGYPDDGGSASTISADGLFLYGTAYSTNGADPKKIIVYSIDQTTGGLTRSSESDTGGGPNDVRLDTTGNFAYTCNTRNSPSVSAFSVNKGTGVLSALTPANYVITAPSGGPGIMVIQRNLN
jgi:6-phosphogluconolactonase (cycloisomerase 2 family)